MIGVCSCEAKGEAKILVLQKQVYYCLLTSKTNLFLLQPVQALK
jgi:hypothetical protein